MTLARNASLLLRRLRADRAGTVVVEVAVIAPILILMALGAFEMSRAIARQHELQTGSLDGEGIVMAAGTGTSLNVNTVKTVLMNSLRLTTDQVTVDPVWRCGTGGVVTAQPTCGTNVVMSSYMRITLTDTYTPIWTRFGFGSPLNYRVVRTVQVS